MYYFDNPSCSPNNGGDIVVWLREPKSQHTVVLRNASASALFIAKYSLDYKHDSPTTTFICEPCLTKDWAGCSRQ